MTLTSLRRRALRTTIIAGMAGLGIGQIAIAQDAEPEEAAVQDTVIVTGSEPHA